MTKVKKYNKVIEARKRKKSQGVDPKIIVATHEQIVGKPVKKMMTKPLLELMDKLELEVPEKYTRKVLQEAILNASS